INWTASDKNLSPEPVTLYYARQKDGPWQVMAQNVANTGSYRWAVPREVGGEMYVRVEVVDRGGNVTRCQTAQAVGMGMGRPKAKVVRVTASDARMVAPPPGN